LKDAVQTHGGKNWEKIAALVPGRSEMQCSSRWHDALVSNIDPMTACTGRWTAVEDIKLKDAVQTHGGKDWAAIAALVPGRTKLQCRMRWKDALDSNIDPTTVRAGKWSEDEDKKLKGAVLTHGGKNWDKIAALVPGRTKKQCNKRWHNALKPNIDRASGHTGK
jgi:myb proto-oncogene protein